VRSAFSQGRSWTCPSPLKWQEGERRQTFKTDCKTILHDFLVFCFTGWLPPFPSCARIVYAPSHVFVSTLSFLWMAHNTRPKKALQRQLNGAKKEQQKGRSTKTPSSLVACVCLRTSVRVFFSASGQSARVTSSTAVSSWAKCTLLADERESTNQMTVFRHIYPSVRRNVSSVPQIMKLVSSVSCVSLEKCVVIRLSHMLVFLSCFAALNRFDLSFDNDKHPWPLLHGCFKSASKV
jgi:hypothetical protein